MRISDWSSDVCSSDLRAALARFEMADAAGMGAGAAALFMPEEFGFDEFAGNRAAVDRGKGLARPDAFVVDRAGDQFLARSEERRVGQEGFNTWRSRWSTAHTQKEIE